MTNPPTELAKPGDVVRIAARDYLDGTADVTVRVAQIAAGLDKVRGLEWVRVLVTDLDRSDAEPRALVVRVTALRQPHAQPREQLDQQANPFAEIASAAASYGRSIPSPRRPPTAAPAQARVPTNTSSPPPGEKRGCDDASRLRPD